MNFTSVSGYFRYNSSKYIVHFSSKKLRNMIYTKNKYTDL